MGAWADAAFDRLREIEGVNHEALQRAAQIRQQVLADAPYLWKQVVGAFAQEIEDFSKKRSGYLSMEDHDELVNLSSPQMYIEVTFDPQSPRLSFEVWKRRARTDDESLGRGSYSFGVYENGIWFFDDKQKLRSTSEVAENILDWLIQIE